MNSPNNFDCLPKAIAITIIHTRHIKICQAYQELSEYTNHIGYYDN